VADRDDLHRLENFRCLQPRGMQPPINMASSPSANGKPVH
jgi:hypothetical protein